MKQMIRTYAWRGGRIVQVISPVESPSDVIEFQFGERVEGI